jgi:hypothetical protein
MQCQVCAALKRELGRASETEALATLKYRARLLAAAADHSLQDALEDVILGNRKRRAHLASELCSHQETGHEELDQWQWVRSAASA